MKIHMSKRLFLPTAVLGGVAVFAAAFFVALTMRSAVAGPSASPDPPNPGHSWSEIGDLPGTMWHSNNDGPGSGLDADTLDGLDSTAFSTVPWTSITSKPAGFADDIDDDILGGLSCANGEIAKWDGSAWQCAADQTGAGGDFWSLTGNSGTTPGTNFVGTTDDQALELHVNGARALRLEPDAISPGVIGGYSGNSVTGGAYGATIGGGGSSQFPNIATDRWTTVGGGAHNQAGNNAGDLLDAGSATVSGGGDNIASGQGATVGGGFGNTASGERATVSGGYDGTASGLDATVSGGHMCTASGMEATVGGGESNTASGHFATVPGGGWNTAAGDYSLAAGLRAKANHEGTFVWADSTEADFASTSADQFLVRASGGVGIGTNSPGTMLDVAGGAIRTDDQLISTVAEGTAPLAVSSTTLVSNLNADLLDGLHASEIGGVGRPGFSTTAVDSPGNVGEYTSVTVGTDGLPLISYYDGTNRDLKVAHCGNAACTSSTITTVDSGNYVGRDTSVTVGADGLPLISYYYWDYGDLRVAHCGNAACTSGNTITTVDSAGDVGFYTSVTVGADGLPLISYVDITNEDLRVAHCGNAACTSSTTTTVDSAGDVGQYTSVTVGADGLALISYYDTSSDDLKVAHCSNRFCVPYHRPR